MKRGARSVIVSFAALLILSCTTRCRAADFYVDVSYYDLSPSTVHIAPGDVVYWLDADDFGPYIISGGWGAFYTPGGIQFNVGTGTYYYTAQSVYGGGSWQGAVVVDIIGPNEPPTVSITTPTNSTVLVAPATFTFAVDASDTDSGLWDVEFWINDVMVDDVYWAPYETTVTNLSAGTYTLKAVAWDYDFATATNTIDITVVNPGPITLSNPAVLGGTFRFNVSGLIAGKTNVLQYSTNLLSSNWIPILTNVAASDTASFTNVLSPGPRFFRVTQLP